MSETSILPRFSVGVGDRFAHQAKAQLAACFLALNEGVEVVPVWNKSNREHTIIGSEPSQTREAADAAVKELGWKKPYFLDADHINLKTVARFLDSCDFFTLDVADVIGIPADPQDVAAFVQRHPELVGTVAIPHIAEPFKTDTLFVERVANKFLVAVQHAGEIYRYLVKKKSAGSFVSEVSMDETDSPQTPVELLIILAAIAFAVKTYGLPENLKLSVHSGSDKFSIYEAIHDGLKKFGVGVHLKTAGTTWLEELIGLAEAGGYGLEIAKEVYAEAYSHRHELCAPYATVIDIDAAKLPKPEEVNGWTSEQYTSALRHDQSNKAYNLHFRQLLHVGFKVAAKMGNRYLEALQANEEVVARNVTTNLFERHIKPVFLGL